MGEFNFALESRFIFSHEIFCRCTLVLLNRYTLNLTINNNSVQFVMHVYEFCEVFCPFDSRTVQEHQMS